VGQREVKEGQKVELKVMTSLAQTSLWEWPNLEHLLHKQQHKALEPQPYHHQRTKSLL